jgi:hypothetical protein
VFPQLIRRSLILGLLLLEVGACATPEPVEPARFGLRLAPATLGESISLQQHLNVDREGRLDELDIALEVDPRRIEMVALAFGQRVMSLQYDGEKMTTWRHLLLPEQVKAEDVLQDLQLTLWPLEAIRNGLPAGWRIEQDGLRRTLFNSDTPVIVIDYSNSSRWGGIVEFKNLRFRYRLTIRSVSNS